MKKYLSLLAVQGWYRAVVTGLSRSTVTVRVLVVVIIALVGCKLLITSHAASYMSSAEAESGTLASGASAINDSVASGGKAVQFGTGTGSCGPSGVCVPVGNITGWNQVYETNFPGTVPVGAFSGCTDDNDGLPADADCTGLKNYGSYYTDWWAYPTGWPDTAEECIEKSPSCPEPSLNIPVGGEYQPEKAVSVSGNEMHINMYRPSTGYNVVAAMVPRQCMNMKYGRYTERFEVTNENPGFKSAHLFYQGNYEIDFPESDYGSPISAYTHYMGATPLSASTTANWTTWHTSVIEWTASSVKFYMDGTLIGTATTDVPNIAMSWILQNESSIEGPYASVGNTSDLNIAWVACYSPAS